MFLYFLLFCVFLLKADNQMQIINFNNDIGNIYNDLNINGILNANRGLNVTGISNLFGDFLVSGSSNLVGDLIVFNNITFSKYKQNLNKKYLVVDEIGLLYVVDFLNDLKNYDGDIEISTKSMNNIIIGQNIGSGKIQIGGTPYNDIQKYGGVTVGLDDLNIHTPINLYGGNSSINIKTANDNINIISKEVSGQNWGNITILADSNIYLSSKNINNIGYLYINKDINNNYFLTTTNQSSIRYKEEINDLSKIKESFKKLRPVSFKYKNRDNSLDYGLIAEELFEIDDFKNLVQFNNNEIEGINYFKLIPFIIKNAIETDQNINEFENEINNKINLILEKILILFHKIEKIEKIVNINN